VPLFELLAEGTPAPVEVPLDGVGPYGVRDEKSNLVVMATRDRIIVAMGHADYGSLEEARQVGIRALERLPETPVHAAGFNLRFSAVQTGDVTALVQAGIDDRLSQSETAQAEKAFKDAVDKELLEKLRNRLKDSGTFREAIGPAA